MWQTAASSTINLSPALYGRSQSLRALRGCRQGSQPFGWSGASRVSLSTRRSMNSTSPNSCTGFRVGGGLSSSRSGSSVTSPSPRSTLSTNLSISNGCSRATRHRPSSSFVSRVTSSGLHSPRCINRRVCSGSSRDSFGPAGFHTQSKALGPSIPRSSSLLRSRSTHSSFRSGPLEPRSHKGCEALSRAHTTVLPSRPARMSFHPLLQPALAGPAQSIPEGSDMRSLTAGRSQPSSTGSGNRSFLWKRRPNPSRVPPMLLRLFISRRFGAHLLLVYQRPHRPSRPRLSFKWPRPRTMMTRIYSS
jgi:hypothetical protein